MATSAQYVATPRISFGAVTTADTSRTAPSTVVTIFTAGSSGSRIDQIDLVGIGTTTASMIRLFIYDGANYSLWKEIPTLAVTPSGTASVWMSSISSSINSDVLPLIIPSGYSLRATINDTQTSSGVNIIARGGDF